MSFHLWGLENDMRTFLGFSAALFLSCLDPQPIEVAPVASTTPQEEALETPYEETPFSNDLMCCCIGDEDIMPADLGTPGDPLGCDWFDPELDLPEDASYIIEPGCP